MNNGIKSIVANFRSSRLANFLSGYASAFNLRGDIGFPDVSHGFARDREALRGDWYRIGSDLSRVMDREGADGR